MKRLLLMAQAQYFKKFIENKVKRTTDFGANVFDIHTYKESSKRFCTGYIIKKMCVNFKIFTAK